MTVRVVVAAIKKTATQMPLSLSPSNLASNKNAPRSRWTLLFRYILLAGLPSFNYCEWQEKLPLRIFMNSERFALLVTQAERRRYCKWWWLELQFPNEQ